MSWFEDSNIKKSYIVQTVSDVGIFSACTQIYLTNISPCAGDTINITGNLGVSGNISGTTYFGDGSQLSGIVTTDNFVTGGVYSASSETLYFTGTTGFTPFSVDVSALLDNTNNFVTGGTYNSSTDIVTLTRNDNVNINITGVSNTFTTGATYNEGTELITFVRNDGNSYTADLAAIASATTNSFTTGATLNGNVIEFANSVLGLDYYNVDLTSIVSGSTNGYTTGATLNGNIIEFANNLLGLDYYNVDLTSLVSGKLDTTSFNTYTADTQTTLNGKLDTTSFNTYSGSVETQINNKTENTNFTSHTGDTTIHYTKGSINLSELGSSAHTHSISEVINLQTDLDGKLPTTTFNTYTGSVVDVHVSSGSYNSSTGDATYENSTGGTFVVSGFTTAGSNNQIPFTNTSGSNFSYDSDLLSDGQSLTIGNGGTLVTDSLLHLNNGAGKANGLEINDFSGSGHAGVDVSINGAASSSYKVGGRFSVSGTGPALQVYGVDVSARDSSAGYASTGANFAAGKFTGSWSTGDGYGVFIDTRQSNTGDNYGLYINTANAGAGNHYSMQIIDGNETVGGGKFLKDTGDGKAQWASITSTDVSGMVSTTLFNTYTGDTETALGTKTTNTNFTSHTGDTTIHYTKGSINLSDLGSSAHTHSISEVVNLQTNLDAKLATTLFNTYTGNTETALGNKLATTTFNSYTGSVVDVHVSSGNANAGTQQLSFTNTTGGTFNVTNSAALFSDNDVNVTGGTYNASTGCVTFTTNSATTFDVCGFVTGLTDTFVTGGTLSGDNLVLERNSGVDVGNIDLSGLVSGKLEISLFNTYTGDTETALSTKGDVFKVGTPVNNQIGVWTGDGTLEGDTGLTWNTAQIEVTDTDNNLTEVRADWVRVYNETDDANLFLYGYGTGHRGEIILGAANGTRGAETATLNGNTVATIAAYGHSGTGFRQGGQAVFAATENYTEGSAYGTRFVLQTIADGSTTLETRYATDGDGNHDFTGDVSITGDVGIGTAIPQEKLHVSTGNDLDSGNISFLIGGTAGTNARTGRIIKNTSSPYEMTIRANDFATGGNLILNDTGGNVGIGKTSPTEALDVSGNTVISGTLNIGTIGGTTSVTNLGIDSSGNVVSGTTGGGGTSYWEETTSTIKLDTGETTRDVVEIATGGANTLSGTYSIGNLLIGDGNTFGNGQTVRRSFIGGNAVVVGASEAFQTSIAFGQTMTVEGSSTSVFGASHIVKGNYNFTAGQNNDLYGDNLTAIGNNNILGTSSADINRSVVIGEDADSYADDQIVIGFGLSTNASWGAAKAIYIGIEEGRSSSGWFSDPTIGSGTNFALGGNNTMRTDVGVIKAGAGRGILYLNNYTGSSVSEPTVDISDSVGLWAKNRDTGVTGLIVKAENGGKTWIGDRIGINTVTPTEALDVSGNTVMSGTLNIGTVNAGTPVKNLAVDSSGNVVESTASNDGVTTVKIFNATPDQELYDDGNIEIHLDDAATDDIEVKVLTNPSSGNVQFGWWSPSDTSAGSASLNIASGQTPLNGNFGDDDTMQIRVFAPNDSSYPYWEVNITKGPSGDPLVIRVTKWSSYD